MAHEHDTLQYAARLLNRAACVVQYSTARSLLVLTALRILLQIKTAMANPYNPFAPPPDFDEFWRPPVHYWSNDFSDTGTPYSPATDCVTSPQSATSTPAQSPHNTPPQRHISTLPLLQLSEWDEEASYDDVPPKCVHYSIEWKLTVKGSYKNSTEETLEDLVLAPGAVWERDLHPKLKTLLQQRLPSNKSYRPDETKISVLVNDRAERKLTKRFDNLDIDWALVEKKLQQWSGLQLGGKRLRIELAMTFVEIQPTAGSAGGAKRRKGTSATDRMLAERAAVLDAEEEASGQPAIWDSMYELFHCTNGSCKKGPYCMREGSKHIKLFL